MEIQSWQFVLGIIAFLVSMIIGPIITVMVKDARDKTKLEARDDAMLQKIEANSSLVTVELQGVKNELSGVQKSISNGNGIIQRLTKLEIHCAAQHGEGSKRKRK